MKAYLIVLCILGSYRGISQDLDSTTMQNLVTKEALPYKEKNGQYMGCGYTPECPPMKVIFYWAFFKKKSNRIILIGRLIHPISSKSDTIGAYSYIFLAQPYGEGFKNVKVLKPSYVRHVGDKHKNGFPYQTGDFEIEVQFGKTDRLYFNPPSFQPIEYCIDPL